MWPAWLAVSLLAQNPEMRQKVESATAGLLKAIALAPRSGQSYANYGEALRGWKFMRGASEAYEQAIRLQPDNAAHYIGLGMASSAMGDVQEAAALFRTALALEPEPEEGMFEELASGQLATAAVCVVSGAGTDGVDGVYHRTPGLMRAFFREQRGASFGRGSYLLAASMSPRGWLGMIFSIGDPGEKPFPEAIPPPIYEVEGTSAWPTWRVGAAGAAPAPQVRCYDSEECTAWARAGECERNKAFMRDACRLSCGPPRVVPPLLWSRTAERAIAEARSAHGEELAQQTERFKGGPFMPGSFADAVFDRLEGLYLVAPQLEPTSGFAREQAVGFFVNAAEATMGRWYGYQVCAPAVAAVFPPSFSCLLPLH